MTAGSDPNGLDRRSLTPNDATALLSLSDEAGWNQTADDWRLMLKFGDGVGYWRAEQPIASALMLPYGAGFAWLSMVLVAAAWRRQGLASRLTLDRLERARTLGLSLRLDATDAGRAVYRRFDFTDQYTFTRYLAETPAIEDSSAPTERSVDLDQAAELDAKVFGANRREVFSNFVDRRPALAQTAISNGACTGFVFGRDGRRATHIGPLVADDPPTAIAFAEGAVRAAGGPVIIDAMDGRPDFLDRLSEMGFVGQRRFTRMSLGEPPLHPPRASSAVAGPEFG